MMRFELSPGCELRPLAESDAEALFALIDADRAHLSRWLPWAGAQDLEGTREFIRLTRRQGADDTGRTLAVVCEGEVAGVVGIEPHDWIHRSASIGYWLGERFQGRGLITTAVRALVEHAVSVWDLNRVEIRAAVGNARSRATPARLGVPAAGILRAAARVGGVYLDIVVYSMLGSQWRAMAAEGA